MRSQLIRLARCAFVLLAGFAVLHVQGRGAAPQAYSIGGQSIVIPSPSSDLVEVGADSLSYFNYLTSDQNVLRAAFTLPGESPNIRAGVKLSLSKYALVEAPRAEEFTDEDTDAFQNTVKAVSEQMGSLVDTSLPEWQNELNRRLQAQAPGAGAINLSKPTILGTYFSKQDAYGFGMILQVTSDGNTKMVLTGATLLRIKNRFVFGYLYTAYTGQESLNWMRKATENWADAILAANKQ